MRKRNYKLAVLTLLTAATIATGWATQAATLIGSVVSAPAVAGSDPRAFGRESSIAGSAGGNAKISRESA